MNEKELAWVDINDLVPWDLNPRDNEEAVPFVVSAPFDDKIC